MKKLYILICLLFLSVYSFFGGDVDVDAICEGAGYTVYERVNLPSEYIQAFTPEMDKGWYGYQFVLNENYYIDKDKLQKDYIFTFQKKEKLKGFETWVSTTDSIVRKSDGKLLAKQVTYSGYKSDEKPWLDGLGHSIKDTTCQNGKVHKNLSISSFNARNIVKDVFLNQDYKWTVNNILGRKPVRSGEFKDLCVNTGIKVYEKERVDESYLILVNDKNQRGVKGYLKYSNFKYYFDIERLESEYIFSYLENQLVPSTTNTRVVRSSVTRKKDNKLIAESITVRGRKNDSYTGTINPDLLCSNGEISKKPWKYEDIHDQLLRNTFFKDKIDDLLFQASKIEKWNDLSSSNKAYTAYSELLKYESEMDLHQLFDFSNNLLLLSFKLDNKESVKKYGNKFISLIKDEPDYAQNFEYTKRRICSKNWAKYKDIFIAHCDK